MSKKEREVVRNVRTFTTLNLKASFKCGNCEAVNIDREVEVFSGWGCDEEYGCNSGVEARCGECRAVNKGI